MAGSLQPESLSSDGSDTCRSKRRSDFAGSATYGYCASRDLSYFGYKLVALTTLDGIPVLYDLVPAHTDERVAAEAVLYALPAHRPV